MRSDRPGRRLLGLLRPHRLVVAGMLPLGFGGIILTILGPRLLGHATDLILAGFVSKQQPVGSTKAEVIERLRVEGKDTLANMYATMDIVPGRGIDFGAIGRVLTITLTLYLVGSLCMFVQERQVTAVVQRVVFDLRETVEAKLARLPLSYFDRHPRGELLSRATNDIDNLEVALRQALAGMIGSLFSVLGMLIMMLVIWPPLALIVLASFSVSGLLAAWISKRAQPQFVKQWAVTGLLNAHAEETYTGHTLIKSFDRREMAERIFDEHNAALANSASKAQSLSRTIEPTVHAMNNLNYVVVAVVGALRVLSGSLSIGDLQAFIQYSGQFGLPIAQIASIAGELQSGVASAERVFALLDADEQEPDPDSPARPVSVRGRVEFECVSFRYSGATPLIECLSLVVEPGQTVAIVGPTGAGKTTLGNLLMRFYELNGGRILLDGTDIASMRREDVRAKIGLVLQDAWLFGGTIAENIAYGCPQATRAEIVAAARAACVDPFVRTLPNGYNTVLDDEHLSLSAGEKQLITVARALLAKPAILVLDEATGSVDVRTEVLVQRAMRSLRADRTSFVIAHRLSTIRDADVILVLESGRIIERGTHDELISNGGTYMQMYDFGAPTPSANAPPAGG